MRPAADLLEQSNASRFLRDLHDTVLADRGQSGDEPALLAPLADNEAAWGRRPDADLRRLAAVLSFEELGEVVFRIDPLDLAAGAPNLWAQLVTRAHHDPHHGCDPTAALHGALPMGWLTRGDRRLSLALLLDDLWGWRSGRVFGLGPAVGGGVARLEKRLSTFLLRVAEDDRDGVALRYRHEELEVWQSRSGWIGAVLQGQGVPEALDDAAFAQLNPVLSEAEVQLVAAGPWPDRLYLLWRGLLLGEDSLLDAVLPQCQDGPRLLTDAAAAVSDLRGGADALGPLTGVGALRAALTARIARAREAGPAAPAVRLEVGAAALPTPAVGATPEQGLAAEVPEPASPEAAEPPGAEVPEAAAEAAAEPAVEAADPEPASPEAAEPPGADAPEAGAEAAAEPAVEASPEAAEPPGAEVPELAAEAAAEPAVEASPEAAEPPGAEVPEAGAEAAAEPAVEVADPEPASPQAAEPSGADAPEPAAEEAPTVVVVPPPGPADPTELPESPALQAAADPAPPTPAPPDPTLPEPPATTRAGDRGEPVPGPSSGRWPSHQDALEPAVRPIVRVAAVVVAVVVFLALIALCCGGLGD